jgi:MmyB-like transcription regulator ligand binding domain
VLGALADALRMSPDERLHLRRLAKPPGDALCTAAEPPARSVRPTVQALLDRLEPTPALVLNRLGDVLAGTAGYARLAGPIGLLDTEPANLVRFVFTDPRARTAYPDWARVADDLVTDLKLASGRGDPHVATLIAELTITAGAPFTGRLAAPPLLPTRTGVERLVHPAAGELRLAYETLELPDAEDQRLIVYLPADDASSAALDRLHGQHPRGLRAVPD